VIPVILLAFVACGGSDSGSNPTEARMNFTNSGLKSSAGNVAITVPTGGRVHYYNTDSVNHQAQSACPELNQAAPLAPGADQLMPVLINPASCTITDTANPGFQSFVTVAAPPPGGSGGGGGSGY
ncbi:MAG: hypothetical protein ACJ781_14110, partial [Myxococcales bacterium]